MHLLRKSLILGRVEEEVLQRVVDECECRRFKKGELVMGRKEKLCVYKNGRFGFGPEHSQETVTHHHPLRRLLRQRTQSTGINMSLTPEVRRNQMGSANSYQDDENGGGSANTPSKLRSDFNTQSVKVRQSDSIIFSPESSKTLLRQMHTDVCIRDKTSVSTSMGQRGNNRCTTRAMSIFQSHTHQPHTPRTTSHHTSHHKSHHA